MSATSEEIARCAHSYCADADHAAEDHRSAPIYAEACRDLDVTAFDIVVAIRTIGFETGSYIPPHPDRVVAWLLAR